MINLLGCYQSGDRYTARLLAWLKTQNVTMRYASESSASAIFEYRKVPVCITYEVWDNGGEIGVTKINDSGLSRMIPTEDTRRALTVETIGYRLLAALRCDDEIDWDLEVPGMEMKEYDGEG